MYLTFGVDTLVDTQALAEPWYWPPRASGFSQTSMRLPVINSTPKEYMNLPLRYLDSNTSTLRTSQSHQDLISSTNTFEMSEPNPTRKAVGAVFDTLSALTNVMERGFIALIEKIVKSEEDRATAVKELQETCHEAREAAAEGKRYTEEEWRSGTQRITHGQQQQHHHYSEGDEMWHGDGDGVLPASWET